VPENVCKFVEFEVNPPTTDQDKAWLQDNDYLRESYRLIPQPIKRDKDNRFKPAVDDQGVQINNSGPVLTEDIIVSYFDGGKIYVVLVASKDTMDTWALPGKRDAAYSSKQQDMSIVDANYALVEKEIGLPRSEVAVNRPLLIVDDRIREERMKSTGVVSFILLKKKPQLIEGKRVGIPMNVFIDLANERVTVPAKNGSIGMKLGRNHDSLVAACVNTSSFYALMEEVKRIHNVWKELRRFVALSDFEAVFECPLCTGLMTDCVTLCTNGHYSCATCVKSLRNNCPDCRQPLTPVRNIIVNNIVQQRYPIEFARANKDAITWQSNELFNGSMIQYQ
jgi:hypothetical protein